MAKEEGGLAVLNKIGGGEDKGIRKIPVLRREPSFSRWYSEVGIDSLNSSSRNGGEDGDFELPIVQIDGADNGVMDREGNSSAKIGHLLNRSNSFRHRNVHLYDEDAGNDSPCIREDSTGNGEDVSLPRNHEDSAGSGENFSPFLVEHENGSVPGRVSSPKDRSFREVTTEDDNVECLIQPKPKDQRCISATLLLRTLFFTLIWYTSSTCLTVYNKSLLGDHLGKFPAPLLMNTVHFTMQALLSKAIMWFWSQRFEASEVMSWRNYFLRVVPTALGTALDINLSNASLVFISVTFATMCKSASPVFLLLFAFSFKLEAPSLKLLGIIFIISTGVLLTVAKETEFAFQGFLFVMLAAVMSGFRWSMTQILLQREAYGLKNPITFMSYIAPIMAFSTALLSLLFDPWIHFKQSSYFDDSRHIIRSCLLMIIGGALAFFMVLMEYILVSATSAVTVTIAGVVKEAVTIVVPQASERPSK
ncbi:probable sugar phosphate/phosphate translocator At1g06470 isoform X3 [Nymphaea colorata]|uniref:probable sugar phosphate/phosphate translocator At1g06470 isoform X3 n=1 Tax=Nymphaea colorata TaxID=210225 RepID=UPI00129DBC99|nr:probable sugar phosphate/phosphate translocator At1g06470 isoform X3 [Nymphaea colorata]